MNSYHIKIQAQASYIISTLVWHNGHRIITSGNQGNQYISDFNYLKY